METVAEETKRRRNAVATELMDRYRELKEREAEVIFDTEQFYIDVANLLGRFSAEKLAERIGVTRDAVYQWARKGRLAKERRNGDPQTDEHGR